MVLELMETDYRRVKRQLWSPAFKDPGCLDQRKHVDSSVRQCLQSQARYLKVAHRRILNYKKTGQIVSPRLDIPEPL